MLSCTKGEEKNKGRVEAIMRSERKSRKIYDRWLINQRMKLPLSVPVLPQQPAFLLMTRVGVY